MPEGFPLSAVDTLKSSRGGGDGPLEYRFRGIYSPLILRYLRENMETTKGDVRSAVWVLLADLTLTAVALITTFTPSGH